MLFIATVINKCDGVIDINSYDQSIIEMFRKKRISILNYATNLMNVRCT